LTKYFLISTAVLLAVIAGLSLYAKSAKYERDFFKLQYEVAHAANLANEEAVKELIREKAKTERLLSERIKEQKQMEETFRKELEQRNKEIAELRKHEEVADWLDSPVPGHFIDWLRGQADNKN